MTARDNRGTARASRHATATTESDHSQGELRGMFGALERLGCIVRLRRETADDLRASFVSLSHSPEDVPDLEQLLGCPVRTGEAWSGWALSREALRLPLRRRDPVLCAWLERKAAEILAQHPPGSGLVSEVRQLLTAHMAAGMRIDVVARSLAVTPRTLQRKLAAFRRWHRVTPQEFRQQRRDA